MRRTFIEELFDELRDDEYIYDMDEDGYNMSYGELFAIKDHMQENVLDEFRSIVYREGFEKACEWFDYELMNSSDDALMFAGLFDTYFDYEIDDNGHVEILNETIPELLAFDYECYLEELDD